MPQFEVVSALACAQQAVPVDAGPAPRGDASILRVNDNPGTLFAPRAALSGLAASVVTVTSDEQALLRQDFAVVLLDVKMPGMDGLETAHLIRQRPRLHATPITFIMPHLSTDLDRAIGYGLGAVDYLFMPINHRC